jgi:hypothetical protein
VNCAVRFSRFVIGVLIKYVTGKTVPKQSTFSHLIRNSPQSVNKNFSDYIFLGNVFYPGLFAREIVSVYFSFSSWLHCYVMLSFETEAAEKAKKKDLALQGKIFGLVK